MCSNNNLVEAYSKLGQILCFNQLEWKLVFSLWSNATTSRSIQEIRTIIDVINQKKFSAEMRENLAKPSINYCIRNLDKAHLVSAEQQVQAFLQENTGFMRQESKNYFETFDKLNCLSLNLKKREVQHLESAKNDFDRLLIR